MSEKLVEIFSANCPLCDETIELVNSIGCSSCEVAILDMNDSAVAEKAKQLGVTRVPAIAINGKLLECCQQGAVTEETLRNSGIAN